MNLQKMLGLSTASGCTKEELMVPDPPSDYENETGLPTDKGYLECGLPEYLEESLENMKAAWKKIDSGEKYLHFDGDYCTLQSDINIAEVCNAISAEQAWYLREKYLMLERNEPIL